MALRDVWRSTGGGVELESAGGLFLRNERKNVGDVIERDVGGGGGCVV